MSIKYQREFFHDSEAFWLVWNPEGNAPKHRHGSESSATKEAERLATLNPNARFYVLKALSYREVNNMVRVELDDVPF